MTTILRAFFMTVITVSGIALGASKSLASPAELSNIRVRNVRCKCAPQEPIYVPCPSTESPTGSAGKVFDPADNLGESSTPTYIPPPHVCVCPRPRINLPCSGADNFTPPPERHRTTPRIIDTRTRRVSCPDGQRFDSTGICRTPFK